MIAGMVDALRAKGCPLSVRVVWALIENRANGHTRTPKLTMAQLAEEGDIDKNTVTRAIRWLVEHGVVTITTRFRGASTVTLLRSYVPQNTEHAHVPQNAEAQEPHVPQNADIQVPQNAEPYTKTPKSQSPSDSCVRDVTGDLFGAPEPPPPPQPKRAKPKLPIEPPGFGVFWAGYPRKVDKQDAIKAYDRALRDGHTVAAIKAGLDRAEFDDREGGRFIPHPTTWLNKRRWLVEATTNVSQRNHARILTPRYNPDYIQ